MLDTTHTGAFPQAEQLPETLPLAADLPDRAAARTAVAPPEAPAVPQRQPAEERRGCLYALSQPPLMIFLAVIGFLLLSASLHDLLLL